MPNTLNNLDWFRLREAGRLEAHAQVRDRSALRLERLLGATLLLVPLGFSLALVGLCCFSAPVRPFEGCLPSLPSSRFPEITLRWAELCQAALGAGLLCVMLAAMLRRRCRKLRDQTARLREEGRQLRREHGKAVATSPTEAPPEVHPQVPVQDRALCPTPSITWTGSASVKRSG